MKLVIDANLSPAVVAALREAGYDASHVGDHGLLAAKDVQIFEWAHRHDAVIVTADSDFAMLLAIRRASKPSVVHIRDVADRPPAVHSALLIANLDSIARRRTSVEPTTSQKTTALVDVDPPSGCTV